MNHDTITAAIDLNNRTPPRHIVVEGPIGVGKTTLARQLADSFNYQTLLEKSAENPFLERFYQNQKNAALATQLFFLFQRSQQIQDQHQGQLFESTRVADFLIEKDRLFAKLTLDQDEYQLYDKVYRQLSLDTAKPDLVIYLQASPEVLSARIHNRGVDFEQRISPQYLKSINEAYSEFFLYYDDAPLLIVNAEELDLVNREQDYRQLLDYLLTIRSGRHYFNPTML